MNRAGWKSASAILVAALTTGAGLSVINMAGAAVAGATASGAAVTGAVTGAASGPAVTGAASGAAVTGAAGSDRLAGYRHQRVDWGDCRQDVGDEAGGELDRAGARCAEITVPLDYTRPGGRAITIAMSRLAATDTANRIGVLLLNTGGPGAPGRTDVLPVRDWMGDVGARYDLIGMDPRFVGRSTPLDCGWPTGTWTRSAGPDRAGFDRVVKFERDLAERCARSQPDLLPYASTRNTARDMDLIRAVLGAPKLSYLGYSYGTYLGAVYAQLFPERAGRMVLDSAVDPQRYGPELLHDAGPANETALRDWARWTADRHSEYGLGITQRQVLATVDRISAAAARRPLVVGDYRVDASLVPFLLFNRLSDDRDETGDDLAETVRVLARAAAGLPAEPTPSLADTLEFALTGAESAYGSVQAAIICADRAGSRDPEHYWRGIREHRAAEPRFGAFVRSPGPCMSWPVLPREQPTRVDNNVPALIVAATGDTRTIYQHALAMHRALTGSRLLTLADARIHGVYGNYANACVDTTVNTYLRDGLLPPTNPTCPTQTP